MVDIGADLCSCPGPHCILRGSTLNLSCPNPSATAKACNSAPAVSVVAVNITAPSLVPATVGSAIQSNAFSTLHASKDIVLSFVYDIGDVVLGARSGAAVDIGRAADDGASSGGALEELLCSIAGNGRAGSKLSTGVSDVVNILSSAVCHGGSCKD